jgi:hypothetical protein
VIGCEVSMVLETLIYAAAVALVAILWLFAVGMVLSLLDFAKSLIESWFA